MLRRLRRTLARRERVVPVVMGATRRRWERAPASDWASALHLRYLQHRDRVQPAYFARSGGYRMPHGLKRVVRWYALDVAVQSLRLVRRHARPVRQAAGVAVARQLFQMLRLSVSVPSMPENYYKFEWYRPQHRARANEYLHRHETKGGLYLMLAGDADLAGVAPLNDKVAFAQHAQRAGLPVVPTLAVVDAAAAPADLPRADLFVKPRSGKGGRSAQRWSYDVASDAFLGSGDGVEVSRRELAGWLGEQAAGQSLIVQPCLVNHPDLADLALDAVATCRIISILNESTEPEPVIAIFRMPAVRGAVVDNMHRGGIAAPVDVATGVLGPATGYASAGPAARLTHHPVSGAAVAGSKLPAWDEARALATAAHAAFRPRVLVGWDISLGPDGPVLVEGNEQPGVDGLQRLHEQPLGAHRFGQLLDFHLRSSRERNVHAR